MTTQFTLPYGNIFGGVHSLKSQIKQALALFRSCLNTTAIRQQNGNYFLFIETYRANE